MTEATGSGVGLLHNDDDRREARSARSRPPLSLGAARELRDSPASFPFGWFAVAFSRELRAGQVVTRRFMGREIVIFRTRSGLARAIEAYCPHLGAHFGFGGTVDGEQLRCPFHGFRFSIDGSCVHSPYGAAPPAARLGLQELREIWGVILVWHGPPGQVPWEIDAPDDDDAGWHRVRQQRMTYRCHPQELTENSVDIGHLAVVHGLQNATLTEQLSTDGPQLTIGYTVTKPVALTRGIDINFRIRMHGVGVQVVEFDAPGGWAVRQLVLYTPVDQHETVAHVGSMLARRGQSVVGKAIWSCLEQVAGRVLLRQNVGVLKQDEPIWNNKKHLGRPAIAAGDGPITAYRRWARQFYPEAATP